MLCAAFLTLLGAAVSADALTHRPGDVEVIGRYRECLDNRLSLFDSTLIFCLDPEAARSIRYLTAGRDNVQLRGTFVSPREFQVSKLAKAPSDLELYQGRAQSLTAAADLLALGVEAVARAERFSDADLRQAGREILRRGWRARKAEIGPADVASHLAWVRDMVTALDDQAWALAEAKEILNIQPHWEPVETFLRSLGCIEWRDDWYTEDAFMRAQGLVEATGTWVAPDEADFSRVQATLAAMQQERRILRKHTDEYYGLRAGQRQIIPGMTRQEALSAWGFPDRVRRIRTPDGTYGQWCYGTRYVYLLDDAIALVPAEGTRP